MQQQQLDPLQQHQQQQQLMSVVQHPPQQRSQLAAHLTQDPLDGLEHVNIVSVETLKAGDDGSS